MLGSLFPVLTTALWGPSWWIPGVLTIKHLTTREKKKLVEGTKSQIKGNAKAKVIIQLRTGRIMSHKKWRTPDAPGQRSGGPGPRGMQRRRPQRLGGGAGPRITGPGGSSPALVTKGSSAGGEAGPHHTVSSSLMSQICEEKGRHSVSRWPVVLTDVASNLCGV